MRLPALMLVAAVLAGCGGSASQPPPPPPGAIPAGESIGTATVHGRVTYRGEVPERKPIRMAGETACSHDEDPALKENLIVGPDGALENAVIHVVSGLGDRIFAPPVEPAEMDQKGCIFVPHVIAVQTNQPILFRSSDPVLHNVHAVAKRNRPFNVSLATRGRTIQRFFSNPEYVRIKCDIHAWMVAWIAVIDNPFHAVTGHDGTFDLSGLPAGTYEVEVWHEELGTTRSTITLADGERGGIEFVFED